MRLSDCYEEGLLKKTKPSRQYASKSLETSLNYIEYAKDNLNLKNSNLVIFCCYTAMFHAARAILFYDGIKTKSSLCYLIH